MGAMTGRRVFSPLAAAALAFANPISSAGAAATPEGVRGHSLAVAWTDQRTIRDPAGQEKQRTQNSALTLYVSATGRVFSRFDRTTGRRDSTTQQQVSDGPDNLLSWKWEGGALVADQHFDRGARRVIVSIDAGGSTCSVRVLHGKEAGSSAIVYTGYNDRVKYEIVSIAVTETSCTIKPGNVFGGAQ